MCLLNYSVNVLQRTAKPSSCSMVESSDPPYRDIPSPNHSKRISRWQRFSEKPAKYTTAEGELCLSLELSQSNPLSSVLAKKASSYISHLPPLPLYLLAVLESTQILPGSNRDDTETAKKPDIKADLSSLPRTWSKTSPRVWPNTMSSPCRKASYPKPKSRAPDAPKSAITTHRP